MLAAVTDPSRLRVRIHASHLIARIDLRQKSWHFVHRGSLSIVANDKDLGERF